jgi:hypothetical protein
MNAETLRQKAAQVKVMAATLPEPMKSNLLKEAAALEEEAANLSAPKEVFYFVKITGKDAGKIDKTTLDEFLYRSNESYDLDVQFAINGVRDGDWSGVYAFLMDHFQEAVPSRILQLLKDVGIS